MKVIIYLTLVFLILTGCDNAAKHTEMAQVTAEEKWIDLGHEFSEKTIYWPNNPTGFKLDTQFNGITPRGFYYSSNAYCSPEHGGTHLDAPIHFAKGKWSVDEIPMERLMGDAVMIDVSAKTNNNPDYQVSIEDIIEWEKQNGKIPVQSILLIRTGWSVFYNDVEKYLGTAQKGDSAVKKLHFPSIHPALAEWILENRTIKAVGVDCPSVDFGQSTDFRTHQLFYAQNIPGFENLTNLDKLPAKGSYVIALPMKIKGGSGAPLRIIARVN
jgi:kynurenine formamidase